MRGSVIERRAMTFSAEAREAQTEGRARARASETATVDEIIDTAMPKVLASLGVDQVLYDHVYYDSNERAALGVLVEIYRGGRLHKSLKG